MSAERWKEVTRSNPCPACGKGDWCAWTPDGQKLKCERSATPPAGMVLVALKDGGALFKYPASSRPTGLRRTSPRPSTPKPTAVFSTAADAVAELERQHGPRAGMWTYRNAAGEPVGVIVRWDTASGKDIRPVSRNDGTAGGWTIGGMREPRPLYGLPDLLARSGERVYVVEGEKCADAAAGLGLLATTSPHGSRSAAKADWTPLVGRQVCILPDADAAGASYAADVAAILSKLSPPAVVKIIDLPGLPEHGDLFDWIAADGTMGSKSADDIKAALDALAEAASLWTPMVLSVSTPSVERVEPYRPFPVDSLPEPLRSFVIQGAAAIGCDAAFVALPLLAATASAIGNTRRIELKHGWTEPAILWAATIGYSGTGKSPAQDEALRPLRRRQHEAMKRHAQEMDAYNAEMMRYDIELATWKKSKGKSEQPKKPEEPVPWRCWCDEITVEALAVRLLENWRGLLMVRDELAGWFGGFDRYAQGKGSDVAKWLEMFGGRSIMVDRKTGERKTIYIPRAAVSVTGGIQPTTLQRALGRAYFENGLAARLLLVYPPRRMRRWTEAEIDPVTETAVATMFDRLYSLEPIIGQDGDPEPGIVQLSPAAKTTWIAFFDEHAHEQVDLTGDLSAAWSKLEGYAARLALVTHLVRWVSDDAKLTAADVADETSIAAGVTLSRWFGQETRRVYAILQETEDDRERRELVEKIQCHGGSATTRELMRVSPGAYPTSDEAEQALSGLVQAGIGRWDDVTPDVQGGRPTRRFILADRPDIDTTPNVQGNAEVSSMSTPPMSRQTER